MNVKGNPYEKRVTKSSKKGHTTYYRREAIWDYEEKVDKERERWRKLYADHKEELLAAQKKFRDDHPEQLDAHARDMLKKGGNEAREKIVQKRNELSSLVDECNCSFPVNLKWNEQEKAIAYFKKLKESRDRIRSEREKSL